MRRAIMVLVVALVMGGCTTEPSEGPPTESPTPVTIPPTPVGEAAAWVVEALNAEEPRDAAAWESVLDTSFLAEVPAPDVVDLLERQFRPERPWTPTAYDGTDDEAVVTLEAAGGERQDMTVVVDASGTMTGLVFTPARTQHEPATSIAQVEERLDDLPGEVSALVLEEHEGQTRTLLEHRSDEVGPLASIAKLFVLICVVEQIDAGELTWSQTLRITDRVRSLPSGRLQDAPEGTEITVAEAAKAMIAISDNTATDLLIERVGRSCVEAAVEDLELPDDAGLIPFPTTREMFALAWGVDAPTAAAWERGDREERRSILTGLDADDLAVDLVDATNEASWMRGVSWFASPRSVAVAYERLTALGAQHPEVGRILGTNPGAGLRFDREAWPTIWFKGGSSRGVVTGSWRAVAEDGRVLTVVLMLAGEDAAQVDVDSEVFFGLAEDLFVVES